mmetsp:Transcript_5803/g.6691  ORF Transcript_5803/g.6691 Transcript_5803/m.6691 type:complete len:133 (-) Transcript_5803:297-695(-)|eukprot:CAMPEP_0184013744 /NCGR_PEP_ID=MMETSP0954-20121128/5197_1 /TAXON_ID=627963 /ORGANISM="Aplanochytrium sp, Strain PBS07" /LENGTH=132 /DNA_ID=CAMNT_0026293995 /DNA_START=99 /DNA_END=497 /DNA_ORIENTATION=+
MEVEISKESWVTQMRLDFCPPEMVEEDGALNLEYFQPKSTADDSLKWNEEDEKRLIIGIQKFGVGNWDEIRKEFLPIWDPVALRIRTMVLFGTQDLSAYKDWKGNKEKIEAERLKNQDKDELFKPKTIDVKE